MSTVTVIGTGNIAGAVAAIAHKGGASLQVLGRDLGKAAALAGQVNGTSGAIGESVTGEIVVLAVPYTSIGEVLNATGHHLSGRVVVDVSNPIDPATFDDLLVPADSSAAAELQQAIPDAQVVKAFSSAFVTALTTGRTGDVPTTVLVAGDDPTATETVVHLITSGGVGAIAVGSLKRAREVEALGFLQITLAVRESITGAGGFALQP